MPLPWNGPDAGGLRVPGCAKEPGPGGPVPGRSEIADRAGAWPGRVRLAELRAAAAGGGPGGFDEQLTAQEHRVAVLAAQSLTNVEVARQLSLSVKTVETHLTWHLSQA